MKPSLDQLLQEASRNKRKKKTFFRELLKHDVHFFVEQENERFEACGLILEANSIFLYTSHARNL